VFCPKENADHTPESSFGEYWDRYDLTSDSDQIQIHPTYSKYSDAAAPAQLLQLGVQMSFCQKMERKAVH
jgi:hypothetical protein